MSPSEIRERYVEDEGNGLTAARRTRYLFSGPIKCAECGGGYSIAYRDQFGCPTMKNKGTCSNHARITRQELETRALNALRNHLMKPERFQSFCEEYTREINRLHMEASSGIAAKEVELKKAEGGIRKIIDAIEEMGKIDTIDIRLLSCLQKDATVSQRDLAEQVGLSQSACWRRLQRLRASGLICGSRTDIDLTALGFDPTVFVMIRTRHHSKEWTDRFRKHVEQLPEVVDFYRIGGDWDYMIKVITRGMAGYDAFYQKLITDFDLATVTGFFSMEAIIENRAADLNRLRSRPPGAGLRTRPYMLPRRTRS